MKSIEVVDGGLRTTVQDLGRYGYQRYGVPTSGALDRWAFRAANRLVGNPDSAAGLEITMVGPRLVFLVPATIAITGADLTPRLDKRPCPIWESITVPEGAVLSFADARDGMRAYLAVAGGIDVPPVLGSRSTYLRSRLGGVDGRALVAGDVLAMAGERAVIVAGRRTVSPADRPTYGHEHRLRVVLGPQQDRFTDTGIQTFLSSSYTVTAQADRMGARLAGPVIEHSHGPDIVSDGTPLGAVQVAGDGMPIVLLADRGTAGGYTKIATVVGADISTIAQATPGDTIRFAAVDLATAHRALRADEARLDRITGCAPDASTGRLGLVAAAVAAVATLLGAEGPRGGAA